MRDAEPLVYREPPKQNPPRQLIDQLPNHFSINDIDDSDNDLLTLLAKINESGKFDGKVDLRSVKFKDGKKALKTISQKIPVILLKVNPNGLFKPFFFIDLSILSPDGNNTCKPGNLSDGNIRDALNNYALGSGKGWKNTHTLSNWHQLLTQGNALFFVEFNNQLFVLVPRTDENENIAGITSKNWNTSLGKKILMGAGAVAAAGAAAYGIYHLINSNNPGSAPKPESSVLPTGSVVPPLDAAPLTKSPEPSDVHQTTQNVIADSAQLSTSQTQPIQNNPEPGPQPEPVVPPLDATPQPKPPSPSDVHQATQDAIADSAQLSTSQTQPIQNNPEPGPQPEPVVPPLDATPQPKPPSPSDVHQATQDAIADSAQLSTLQTQPIQNNPEPGPQPEESAAPQTKPPSPSDVHQATQDTIADPAQLSTSQTQPNNLLANGSILQNLSGTQPISNLLANGSIPQNLSETQPIPNTPEQPQIAPAQQSASQTQPNNQPANDPAHRSVHQATLDAITSPVQQSMFHDPFWNRVMFPFLWYKKKCSTTVLGVACVAKLISEAIIEYMNFENAKKFSDRLNRILRPNEESDRYLEGYAEIHGTDMKCCNMQTGRDSKKYYMQAMQDPIVGPLLRSTWSAYETLYACVIGKASIADVKNKIKEAKDAILSFFNSPDGALGMNRVLNTLRSDNAYRLDEFYYTPWVPGIPHANLEDNSIDIQGSHAVSCLVGLRSMETALLYLNPTTNRYIPQNVHQATLDAITAPLQQSVFCDPYNNLKIILVFNHKIYHYNRFIPSPESKNAMWTTRLAHDTIQCIAGTPSNWDPFFSEHPPSFWDFDSIPVTVDHYPKLPANATIEQGAAILLESLISKLLLLRRKVLPLSDLENKINEGKNLILRFFNSPNGALGMNRVMNFLRSVLEKEKERVRFVLTSPFDRGLSGKDSTFEFDKIPYDPNILEPQLGGYKAIDNESTHAVFLLIGLRSAEALVECAKKHRYTPEYGTDAEIARIMQSAEDQYSIPDFQAKVMRQFKEELDFCRKELLDKREDIVEVVEAKIARLKQM